MTTLAAVLAGVLRAPWPGDDFKGLHDAVSDHGGVLSAGHASLAQHSSRCTLCHFAHATRLRRPLWQSGGFPDAAAFERESMQAGGGRTGLCLSCHDGVVASALRGHSTSTTGQRPHSKASTPAGSHPVGADYLEAFRRNPDDYNDPALSPKIVLEEGLVGCSSCHAAHDLGTVSAFNVREDVCMACHQR